MRRYPPGVQDAPIYEVRCERCGTSFAPETRRCIHCGGPVGRGYVVGSFASEGDVAAGRESPVADLPARIRNPLWVLTVILAVAVSVVRTCAER
jgi:uncharacterized OB-fold protein